MDTTGALEPLNGGTLTVGNITTGCVQTWPWDNAGSPGIPYVTPYITTWTEPWCCNGNVHVFGCDHAEKCKCGKSKRKVEPPKCQYCGKSHS